MSQAVIQHFLLVFDHRKSELVCSLEYGSDSHAAVEAYSDMEKKYQGDDMMDIVLIGSDSLETVKLTHANYFDGTVAMSKYLVGI
jgi:hypothetical protein